MLADMLLQASDSIMPDHEPELQCPETAPELDVPIAVIDYGAAGCCGVAKVLGQDRKGVDQRLAVGDPETIAVEVGEHPLVWIEGVAIRQLDAFLDPPQFGADRADLFERIDRQR